MTVKKLLALAILLSASSAACGQGLFNLYGPVAGVQFNPGGTYQNSAASAAQIAATYTGATNCSTGAALLFNAQCSPFSFTSIVATAVIGNPTTSAGAPIATANPITISHQVYNSAGASNQHYYGMSVQSIPAGFQTLSGTGMCFNPFNDAGVPSTTSALCMNVGSLSGSTPNFLGFGFTSPTGGWFELTGDAIFRGANNTQPGFFTLDEGTSGVAFESVFAGPAMAHEAGVICANNTAATGALMSGGPSTGAACAIGGGVFTMTDDPVSFGTGGVEMFRLPAAHTFVSFDFGILIGAPTGGYEGVGTLNATGLFVNGVAVSTSAATGANPTGTVALATVNGSATTFMRSDAAPPLSQAIAPTWTGTHFFDGVRSSSSGTQGISIGTAGVGGSGSFVNPTGGTDAKIWDLGNGIANDFQLRAVNDAYSTAKTVLDVTRSGFAVTGITIGNATDLPPITLDGPVTIPVTGTALTLTSSSGGGIAELIAATLTGTQTVSYWIGTGLSSGNSGGMIWNNNSGTPYLSLETFANGAPIRIGAGTSQILLPSLASSVGTGFVCIGAGFVLSLQTTCGVSTEESKIKIEPLTDALASIMRMRPVHYELKDPLSSHNPREQIGLIAEEVETIDPRLVPLDDHDKPATVDYPHLSALLVQGEKELEHQVWALRAALAGFFLWNLWLTGTLLKLKGRSHAR